jgi:preprotein translocase subunit SecE
VGREFKRDMERQRQRGEKEEALAEAPPSEAKRERTGTRQFVREVRGELKRVVWPSRKEVAQYSLVVLVAVSLITLFIFGLDQAFGQFVFEVFG